MATEDTATDIKLSTHRSGTLARSSSTTTCVWAFAVDYGDATYVAVSWEEDGALWMGLVDPLSARSSSGEWTISSSTEVSSGLLSSSARVADHWHIFAFGYQILTFSVDSADDLWMLVVDTTLAVVQAIHVANADGSDSPLSSLPDDTGTNDHFCVQADDTSLVAVSIGAGSAAGAHIPIRHYVYVVDIDTELIDSEGDFTFSGSDILWESSATWLDQSHPCSALSLRLTSSSSITGYEWQVLAPGALSGGANVLYLLATEDLATESAELLSLERDPPVAGWDSSLQMATQVLFSNGFRFVFCRSNVRPSPSVSPPSDAGDIVYWLLDDTLGFASGYSAGIPRVIGRTSTAIRRNRPHTSRFSSGGTDYLILCWDERDGCHMRVYALAYG